MKKLTIFLLATFAFFVPFLVCTGYYEDSLVPCGPQGPMCTLCHFILMGDRIFEFILKISLAVAVLFAAISGILYIISSGSEGIVTAAKEALRYALIGFGLCLIAWILVQILASALGYKNEWWKLDINCVSSINSSESIAKNTSS